MRRRRHTRRKAKPQTHKRLDQPTTMFAYAQDAVDWTHWRYRSVSLRRALEMLQAGEAEPMTRKTPNGVITFFRETKPARISRDSPTSLTMGTMRAVVNASDTGKKDAVKLSGAEMAEVVRFRMWPLVGDAKAVRVSPRMSEQDRKDAAALTTARTRPADTQGATIRAEYYGAAA